ncbi:DUF1643 domain-containing protein [Acetobacteraceae bacterium H6797]|nr:DUF1643 domain-containing protein [Acetobacteraceae bacterium H6797]
MTDLSAAKSVAAHDPGGKRLLALPPGTEGSAVFDGPGDCYRYRLLRRWDAAKPVAMFLMMNPSTAIPKFDDPSVAKCGRFARKWGYGSLLVGNTFAYRCTDQMRLMEVPDPVGPGNDAALLAMAREASVVVCAWGKPKIPPLRARGLEVAKMLTAAGIQLHVLELSLDGTPKHPLYINEKTQPQPWTP